jgi:uncharacterized protein YacL
MDNNITITTDAPKSAPARNEKMARFTRGLFSFKGLFSLVCCLILGGIGLGAGLGLRPLFNNLSSSYILVDTFRDTLKNDPTYYGIAAGLTCIGILVGMIIGPRVAQSLINAGNAIERMSTREKVAVGVGTFLGIMVSLPFFLVLSQVRIVGIPLSILLSVAFVYLGIRAVMSMKDEFRFVGSAAPPTDAQGNEVSMEHCKILDTNVIIDGRIHDVCKAGFLEGTIYIPGFVLDELQHIADSSDSLKRARGRRGLDILNAMQKELPLVVRSYDHMAESTGKPDEVDTRLVKLAKNLGGDIVTNDFNLNKVAALQGVTVLNVNELANALKPVVLPGEEMPVAIIKEGKEQNQGVAYLDDGTMIVVEDGRRHIGEKLDVIVTSVLQTVAGKMIFARMKGSYGDGDDGHDGRGRSGGGPRYKVR